MKEIAEIMAERVAKIDEIRNGYAKFSVLSKGEQSLYVSIAFDECWKITRNGTEIKPNLLGDCMLSIPLVNGENKIEMEYHIRGVKLGIMISLLGLLLLLVLRKKYKSIREIKFS